MSTELQVLKTRLQRNNLLVTDPEVAQKSLWKAILGLFDDDGCSSCGDGCQPGCQPGCNSGCNSCASGG